MAKAIADETARVSTTDLDGLCALVREKKIDGAFCGPSEFNLRNLIRLCERAGLPCYTTMQTWDLCANKDVFKQYCRQYGVDCTPEYAVTDESPRQELEALDYPVIVKPVDGCSSKGISVCRSADEVRAAYRAARQVSACGRVIVEKYIENGGELFGVRYLLREGEAYPYFMMDTYVVDPSSRAGLISGFSWAPSRYREDYLQRMDQNVRAMLRGMGLRKGTAFIQSLPYQGKIYFHEMGYRLSGGMLFKLTEPLVGVNDMKRMIRCALGGDAVTEEEAARIDAAHIQGVGAQLTMPLKPGTVGRIEGLEAVRRLPQLKDFIQYYREGQRVEQSAVGTLSQHFGRFSLIADDQAEILAAVKTIQETVRVYDAEGGRMNVYPFDVRRVQR